MTNSPAVIQGTAIEPGKVLDPKSVPAHSFAGVLHKLITGSQGVFKTETEVNEALNAVEAFERSLVPSGDRRHVVSETDPAGREDVTQRVAPQAGGAPAIPAGTPQIDYGALARALVQANAEREAAQQNADSEPQDEGKE